MTVSPSPRKFSWPLAACMVAIAVLAAIYMFSRTADEDEIAIGTSIFLLLAVMALSLSKHSPPLETLRRFRWLLIGTFFLIGGALIFLGQHFTPSMASVYLFGFGIPFFSLAVLAIIVFVLRMMR